MVPLTAAGQQYGDIIAQTGLFFMAKRTPDLQNQPRNKLTKAIAKAPGTSMVCSRDHCLGKLHRELIWKGFNKWGAAYSRAGITPAIWMQSGSKHCQKQLLSQSPGFLHSAAKVQLKDHHFHSLIGLEDCGGQSHSEEMHSIGISPWTTPITCWGSLFSCSALETPLCSWWHPFSRISHCQVRKNSPHV